MTRQNASGAAPRRSRPRNARHCTFLSAANASPRPVGVAAGQAVRRRSNVRRSAAVSKDRSNSEPWARARSRRRERTEAPTLRDSRAIGDDRFHVGPHHRPDPPGLSKPPELICSHTPGPQSLPGDPGKAPCRIGGPRVCPLSGSFSLLRIAMMSSCSDAAEPTRQVDALAAGSGSRRRRQASPLVRKNALNVRPSEIRYRASLSTPGLSVSALMTISGVTSIRIVITFHQSASLPLLKQSRRISSTTRDGLSPRSSSVTTRSGLTKRLVCRCISMLRECEVERKRTNGGVVVRTQSHHRRPAIMTTMPSQRGSFNSKAAPRAIAPGISIIG